MDLSHHSQSLYQLNLVADPSGAYGASHPAKNRYITLSTHAVSMLEQFQLKYSQIILIDKAPTRILNARHPRPCKQAVFGDLIQIHVRKGGNRLPGPGEQGKATSTMLSHVEVTLTGPSPRCTDKPK